MGQGWWSDKKLQKAPSVLSVEFAVETELRKRKAAQIWHLDTELEIRRAMGPRGQSNGGKEGI